MNVSEKYFVEPHTSIGRGTYIGEGSRIAQYVTIGNYCSIANLSTIGSRPHEVDGLSTYPFLGEIRGIETVIGHDVWIGSNSVILAGRNVGTGAVIGAGSVVTRDVEPYAIVVGNPARLLRFRFPEELRKELLDSKWWELPEEEIKALPIRDPKMCLEMIRKSR